MKYFDALFSLFAAVLLSALLPFSVENEARTTSKAPHFLSSAVQTGAVKEEDDSETAEA